MKRFAAIALIVAVALPAFAQRGGGRGGSVGHSFSGTGTGSGGRSELGSGRWSTAPSTRFSLGSTPQFGAGRAVSAAPAFRFAAGNAARRPGYPGGIYRRPVYGAVVPYSVGWLGSDAFAYAGSGFYDSPSNYDPGYSDPGAQANYPAQGYAGPPYPEPSAPGDAYRPAYGRAVPAPAPEIADAVTLVFNDGRPSQQIHNYLLTRTTLYVRDQQRREIPVDEIDLSATERLNRLAGVEFQLPGGAK